MVETEPKRERVSQASVIFFPGLFVPKESRLCLAIESAFPSHCRVVSIGRDVRRWSDITDATDAVIEHVMQGSEPVILGGHSVAASILSARLAQHTAMEHPNIAGVFLLNPDPNARETARTSQLLRSYLLRSRFLLEDIDTFLKDFPEDLQDAIAGSLSVIVHHPKTLMILGAEDELVKLNIGEQLDPHHIHIVQGFGHAHGNLKEVRDVLSNEFF